MEAIRVKAEDLWGTYLLQVQKVDFAMGAEIIQGQLPAPVMQSKAV